MNRRERILCALVLFLLALAVVADEWTRMDGNSAVSRAVNGPPTVEWVVPQYSEPSNQRFVIVPDGVEIGLRSDGVVVWRRGEVEP